MAHQALHTKYRPQNFDEVVGQDAVIKSLSKVIKRRGSQAFIFDGPSGTGKTTLARIAAYEVGCLDDALIEIDAATNTGVDDMRKLQEVLRYRPFGKSDRRGIIIDEAHGLSKNAWDAILKATEEPPEHIVWFFCTTNIAKVPATIKTRCSRFQLKLVGDVPLRNLAKEICDLEKIKMHADIIDIVVKEALGSPRQMLVNLEMCRDIDDRKEAAMLLHSVVDGDAVRELCQFLLKGGSWMKVSAILKKLEKEPPESVRIVVCNYMGAVMKGATTEKQVVHVLGIIQEFATPYNQAEGMAPLYLSVGRVLFSN